MRIGNKTNTEMIVIMNKTISLNREVKITNNKISKQV